MCGRLIKYWHPLDKRVRKLFPFWSEFSIPASTSPSHDYSHYLLSTRRNCQRWHCAKFGHSHINKSRENLSVSVLSKVHPMFSCFLDACELVGIWRLTRLYTHTGKVIYSGWSPWKRQGLVRRWGVFGYHSQVKVTPCHQALFCVCVCVREREGAYDALSL